MNKEELSEKISVVLKSEIYLKGRICHAGTKLSMERYKFSPYTMIAVDKKGEALEEQPTKLETAMIRKALGESDSTAEKIAYPIIGSEEVKAKEDAKNKAIAEAAAEAATANASPQGANVTAIGGGASSLV